jgi:hypothetical protein
VRASRAVTPTALALHTSTHTLPHLHVFYVSPRALSSENFRQADSTESAAQSEHSMRARCTLHAFCGVQMRHHGHLKMDCANEAPWTPQDGQEMRGPQHCSSSPDLLSSPSQHTSSMATRGHHSKFVILKAVAGDKTCGTVHRDSSLQLLQRSASRDTRTPRHSHTGQYSTHRHTICTTHTHTHAHLCQLQ